jgi:formate dehydrogenase major subunit
MNTASTQVTITIDGKECLVDDTLTVLEAAKQYGIPIPTLCHHPALSNWGGCRLCVVQVDGSPKLAASCATPVRKGMTVVTTNDRIKESRRTILEFLFAERNHNCMFCPQSGDCELQKLAYDLGMDHVTVPFSFHAFPTDVTSDHMAIDHNRCVLCGRCIRACQEIVGANVLGFHNRGPKTMVGLDLLETRERSTCLGCGACLQVCPTGAIYNRYRTHYAVKGHPAEWEASESFCPMCGLLCPTTAYTREGQLIKVEGLLLANGDRPDRGQLCSIGRFDALKDVGGRLRHPMQRNPDGSWAEIGWEEALSMATSRLAEIRRREGGEALFGWTSSMASNEELMLFKELMQKGWSAVSIDTFDGPLYRNVVQVLQKSGTTYMERSWKEIAAADMVLVIGADPSDKQTLLHSLVRKRQREQGIAVAVIGRHACPLPIGAYQIMPEEGRLSDVVRALSMAVRNAIGAGSDAEKRTRGPKGETVELLLSRCGLGEPERKIFENMVAAYVAARNPTILIGTSLTGLQSGDPLKDVREMAFLKSDPKAEALNLIILKPAGNSAGAWRLGIAGTEPVVPKERLRGGVIRLAGPEDEASESLSGLEGLEFLAVFSPYVPERLGQKANLLIPVATWMETDGSYMSLDGRDWAYRSATLDPPEGVRPMWQILCELMERCGSPSATPKWDDIRERAKKAL